MSGAEFIASPADGWFLRDGAWTTDQSKAQRFLDRAAAVRALDLALVSIKRSARRGPIVLSVAPREIV